MSSNVGVVYEACGFMKALFLIVIIPAYQVKHRHCWMTMTDLNPFWEALILIYPEEFARRSKNIFM